MKKSLLEKLYTQYTIGLLIVMLSWGTYYFYIWPKMLFWKGDDLVAGWIGIWADWSAHFSYASALAYRQTIDWLTTHPLYHEMKFTYPFAADLISGILIRFGIDYVHAFIIPSIIATIFLVIVLYTLYYFFLKTAWQAFLALTLFFAGGGIGFYWFILDFLENPTLKTLRFPPKEYTHLSENSIEWINLFSGQLIPQRAMLLGMPVVIAITLVLLSWIQRGFQKVSFVKLAVLGCFSSILLVVHIHSYIAFVIFCIAFFACNIEKWREWTIFGLSTAVPSIIIYMSLYGDGIKSSFFSWYPGWLANHKANDVNFFYFWWVNWGTFLPLSIWAVYRTKYYKHSLVIGCSAIFVICNLVLFQPNPWDNSKIFSWCYLVLCIPVASYLSKLWKVKNIGIKILAALLFVSMTASGFLDLWRLTNTERLSMTMWNDSHIELAQRFREISKPTDRVLVAPVHNHWVSTLAGRQILLGYKGWMWTYGIDYGKTDSDIKKMFSGKSMTGYLLKKYDIKYVVVGNTERGDYGVNELYFRANYEKVLENKEYRIYKMDKMKMKQDPADKKNGLIVEFYDNMKWEGKPVFSDIAMIEQFSWNGESDKPISSPFSIVWMGNIRINKSGLYRFRLESDDGSWLYIDNTTVINNGGLHAVKSEKGEIFLKKAKHQIKIKYFDKGGSAVFNLLWQQPTGVESKIPLTILTPEVSKLDKKTGKILPPVQR